MKQEKWDWLSILRLQNLFEIHASAFYYLTIFSLQYCFKEQTHITQLGTITWKTYAHMLTVFPSRGADQVVSWGAHNIWPKWGQQCYGTSEEGCEQEPTYPRCIPYCFVQLPVLLRETFFPRHFLPQFKPSTIIFSVAKLKTQVMCLTDKRQSSENR